MRNMTLLLWLAAICVAGFFSGHGIAQVVCPCEGVCNAVDGPGPMGNQGDHNCNFTENQCPTNRPDACTSGWCRRDDCNPCPGKTTTITAWQCQNEEACRLGTQQVSLCQPNCGS